MYDERIATHYAAYRPPLHSIILKKALSQFGKRANGLDLGCGAGHSAIALTDLCDRVLGLEPSESMLRNARRHKNIYYINATGEKTPFAAGVFDVVTLAGSLNYIEADLLIDELVRICSPDAKILIYDFDIQLQDFESCPGLEPGDGPPNYDHSTNLAGFSEVQEIAVVEDQLSISASPQQIAHLLLSDSGRYDSLRKKYKASNLAESVRNDIKVIGKSASIKANIFYSLYSLS